MHSGIRQGCPLSPLIFVVVVDGLLRELSAKLPECIPLAYADNTAVVSTDFRHDLPVLQSVLANFAMISCLRLSLPKTVIIPLGDTTLDTLAQ